MLEVLGPVVFVILPAAMIYAAVYDALTMTIPNKVSLALIAGFPIAALVAGLPAGVVLDHLAIGALVLAVMFGLFVLRLVGGGDAKLIAAASLWFGPSALLAFMFTTAIAGGLLALVVIMLRRTPLPTGLLRFHWLVEIQSGGRDIPYGIAIATGALMVYPETAWRALMLG